MKILKSLLLIAACVVTIQATYAQGKYVQGNDAPTGAGGLCNHFTGQCINYWFPTGAASQTAILPGSFTYNVLSSTSNSYDTVTTAFTYDKKDSLVNKAVITLTADKYLTAGAFVTLQLGGASDSSRSVYIYQDATPIDTVTVTNHKKHATYIFDGTAFQAAYK